MRTPIRSRIAGTSTLMLSGFGTLCIFCGLILLASINAMLRSAPVQPQSAEVAQEDGLRKDPVKVISTTQADVTSSIPQPRADAAAAAPGSGSQPGEPAAATRENVRPIIGRPTRSPRKAAGLAQRYSVKIGRDLKIAATGDNGRRTRWVVTTSTALSSEEAIEMCSVFRRHRVRCE
jgi:hypothetical protein